ncbi:hypothetical protein LZ32DRAFT_326012 [Colletotrichum eremochloae]|nr:hypothetical protein LZ32DRAFT_326012 [Colletotrichum eremochloae]
MVSGESKIPPVKYHTPTLTPLLISVGSITVLFTSLASQDCVAILHNWEYFTYPYHFVQYPPGRMTFISIASFVDG